ncbi:hypothetical protein FA13DRAFT_1736421 [Coprinellus micaceus]|uniref:Uncharacterized protein n=1 Tax=Coprinellus micaceus TaxID=71717 RepID=A0A4Y7T0B0_COPMI|nr:hypothetical protein FA13DRAFT_1736421 [Coprinellus micaceus]
MFLHSCSRAHGRCQSFRSAPKGFPFTPLRIPVRLLPSLHLRPLKSTSNSTSAPYPSPEHPFIGILGLAAQSRTASHARRLDLSGPSYPALRVSSRRQHPPRALPHPRTGAELGRRAGV